MYDVIIVGGGPAGLTAAIYAIRKRLNVLLLSQDLGGKTNYRMELAGMDDHQIIRGVETVEKFWRELDYLEFARRLEPVRKISKKAGLFTATTVSGQTFDSRSVVLSTGSRVKKLGVPGEDHFFGRGLSYSAISHAPLFLGKRTVVIGDGDLALRAVTELALVAHTVHLVAPTSGALRTPIVKRLATDLRVVVWEGYAVKEIQGDTFAEKVVIEAAEGTHSSLQVDGVFIEMGLIPNSEPVQGVADLDDQGRVIVDNVNRTTCPGLFAAGDVTNAYAEQVLIAVGEGAKAALSAYDFLLPKL